MLAGRSLSSRKCKFFLNPTEKHPFGHVCMKKDLYLSYPGRTNVSCISLQTWRPAHMNMRNKKRVGSAIRVTHLAGSPFSMVGSTFLHINTLGSARSTGSRGNNQSMRKRCCQLLALSSWLAQRGPTFSLKLTQLGG